MMPLLMFAVLTSFVHLFQTTICTWIIMLLFIYYYCYYYYLFVIIIIILYWVIMLLLYQEKSLPVFHQDLTAGTLCSLRNSLGLLDPAIIYFRSQGLLEQIPAISVQRQGYTLDRSPAHCRLVCEVMQPESSL